MAVIKQMVDVMARRMVMTVRRDTVTSLPPKSSPHRPFSHHLLQYFACLTAMGTVSHHLLLLWSLYAYNNNDMLIDAATFLLQRGTSSYSRRGTSRHSGHLLNAKLDRSETDFWQQPSPILCSILSSPPPKEVLDQIRIEPYKGGFEPASDFDEQQIPKIIYGSIPDDLVGTLAINSPGRIRIGGRMLGHWFDGDGYISTLSFDGRQNEVKVFGRFIRTSRFLAQELQDKNNSVDSSDVEFKPPLVFSGAWTKAGSGYFYENIVKIPQNPSNTNVMWLPPLNDSMESRLFALCEGGHPIEIDPRTLNVLHDEQPFESAHGKEVVTSFFSAHYSIDSKDNTIYNHGYKLDLVASPTINLMKLSASGQLLQQEESGMPYNTFVHDSTITQSFLTYIVCPNIIPSRLELIPFIFGQQPLGGLIEWKGGNCFNDVHREKSYLHVHSKDDLALKWRIEIPHPMSAFHIVDAFEEHTSDHEIYLSIRVAEIMSSNPPCNRQLLEKQFANQYAVPLGTRLHSTLKEYIFHLDNDETGGGNFVSCRYIGDEMRNSIPCDYPVTNVLRGGNRLRYTWVNTLASFRHDNDRTNVPSGWFDSVQKIDMENRELSSHPITFGEGVVSYLSYMLFAHPGLTNVTLSYPSSIVVLHFSSPKRRCAPKATIHEHKNLEKMKDI